MLKRVLGEQTNWRAALTLILFVIACFEASMAYTNYQYAKRQANIEALVFTRENINGYTFLYGQFHINEVFTQLSLIRDARLPAIAVPSQYGDENQWLIIAPSFGNFRSQSDAQHHILGWRDTILKRGVDDNNVMQLRANLLRTYRERFGSNATDNDFVPFYKADIVNWGSYFKEMAQSDLLYVNPKTAVQNIRPTSALSGL